MPQLDELYAQYSSNPSDTNRDNLLIAVINFASKRLDDDQVSQLAYSLSKNLSTINIRTTFASYLRGAVANQQRKAVRSITHESLLDIDSIPQDRHAIEQRHASRVRDRVISVLSTTSCRSLQSRLAARILAGDTLTEAAKRNFLSEKTARKLLRDWGTQIRRENTAAVHV